MSAFQREFGFVVVERIIVPTGRLVTQLAFLAKSARVFIILFVAGKTFRWRFLWSIGCVTILAGDIHVLAFQFEGGQVVVERGGSPRLQRVTLGAVRAEAALVRFILPVTGETIPRRRLQIHQRARRRVTSVAVHFHVRAHQRKGDLAVIEVFIVGVHTIVTGQAVIAPTERMSLRESQIQISMTFEAGGGIKRGQILHVTVCADKRLACHRQLVAD